MPVDSSHPAPGCLPRFNSSCPQHIVIHDTESDPDVHPAAIACGYARAGWANPPYHFMISKVGKEWRVIELRPLKFEGADVGSGLNCGSISIAMAGDYGPGKGADVPPPEAIRMLSSLVAKLKNENPNIRAIDGHGEAKMAGNGCYKDCPGPGLEIVAMRLDAKYGRGSVAPGEKQGTGTAR
jgi:hypothetical protein